MDAIEGPENDQTYFEIGVVAGIYSGKCWTCGLIQKSSELRLTERAGVENSEGLAKRGGTHSVTLSEKNSEASVKNDSGSGRQGGGS
jgi:hypothetical protein